MAGAVGGLSRYAIKDWTLNPINLLLGATNNAFYELTSSLGLKTWQGPFVEGVEGGLRSLFQIQGFKPHTWRGEISVQSPDILKGISHGILSGMVIDYASEHIHPPMRDGLQYILDETGLTTLIGEKNSAITAKCLTQPIAVTALKSFLTKGDIVTAAMSALGQLSTCVIRAEGNARAEAALNHPAELADDHSFPPMHDDA